MHCFVVPAGDHFSAGLDIAESTNLGRVEKTTQDVARRAFLIRNVAKAMQVSRYEGMKAKCVETEQKGVEWNETRWKHNAMR